MSASFAVAVTMTKEHAGVMNILTRLNVWPAESMDEAVGRAVLDAQECNPGHQIFTIAKMLIPPAACDSGSDPQGGDAVAAPGEASQSGGAEGAASPTLSSSNPETPNDR